MTPTANTPTDSAHDRYPGLRSFEWMENNLFRGREQETQDLLDLIRVEQLVVLFSKSGLGKTSLLNAGISPILLQRGYWPVRVRFQPMNPTVNQSVTEATPSSPLDRVGAQLDKAFREAYQPPIEPGAVVLDAGPERLWEWVKVRPFPKGATLVLVFDQFEEFFNYARPLREEFLIQLSELIHDRPPVRVSNWLLNVPAAERTPEQLAWCQQPPVKCLFAIRSDRLFEMDSIRPFISLILRNRFELGPLQAQAAEEAITVPAQLRDGTPFSTPPFRYEPDTLKLMLAELSDKTTGFIEGAQLQMVCNHIEEYLKVQLSKGAGETIPRDPQTGDLLVGTDIIPDQACVQTIINEFYKTQLQLACSGQEDVIDQVGKVIEEELIEGEQRVGCPEIRLRNELGDQASIIDRLREFRLIRPETSHLGLTYELSHDTLIKPVVQARLERQKRDAERAAREARDLAERAAAEDMRQQEIKYQQRETTLRRIGIAIGAVLSIIGVIVLYYTEKQSELKKSITNFAAAQQFELGRHYKAYRLWVESNSRGDSGRSFVPFSGIDLNTDAYRAFVAVQYNDGLEIFQAGAPDSVYKNRMPIQLRINANDYFTIGGATLITHADTTFSGYRISAGKLHPFLGKHALLPPDSAHLLSGNEGFKLSPTGRFLLVQSDRNLLQLYRIDPSGVAAEQDNFSAMMQQTPPKNRFGSVVFSADEHWLLLREMGTNRLYLFNLTASLAMPVQQNVNRVRISTSGRQIVWVDGQGQVWVRDLPTQQTQLLKPVGLPSLGLINELSFIRHDSSLLITSRKPLAKARPTTSGLPIDRLDLLNLNQPASPPQTVLTPRAVWFQSGLDVFQVLSNTGRWLVYNPGLNQLKPTRFLSVDDDGVDDSWQQFRLDHDAQNQLIIYDLIRQIRTRPKPVYKFDNRIEARFCPVRGQATPRLAVLFPDSLLLVDLRQFPLLRYDKVLKVKAKFNAMTFVGDMIQLGAEDGFKALVFADGRKNQLSYLSRYIYPELSPADRKKLGID